jgi:hypothetical protein
MKILRQLFGSSQAIYARHFKYECNIAQAQLRLIGKETGREISLDNLATELFHSSGLANITRSARSVSETVYSPAQLRAVVRIILAIPKPLGPYIILYKLESVTKAYSIQGDVKGDILIAMEQIRAVHPDLVESAAEFLAHSLCLMTAGLKSAREIYAHIGTPYTTKSLSPQEIQRLLANGFVSKSEIEGNRLRQDTVIKELTRKKLYEIDEAIANLITLPDD